MISQSKDPILMVKRRLIFYSNKFGDVHWLLRKINKLMNVTNMPPPVSKPLKNEKGD